jgi:hypothetical protein
MMYLMSFPLVVPLGQQNRMGSLPRLRSGWITLGSRGRVLPDGASRKGLTDAGSALALRAGGFGGLVLPGDMPHNLLAA